jgi:ferric-dicitrate binding protein FerR (iron transport regulator)
MRGMRPLISTAVLLAAVALASSAQAERIGKATSAVPTATFSDGGDAQDIEIGTTFEQNDRIKTGKGGAAELEFLDGTSLTIGENSEIVLDKMIFDRDRAKSATVEVVKGTLRFVTGNSDHSAYQIKTPVATIGVRGTVIDVSLDQGDMVFNTVEGVGIVCHGGTNCRDIRAGEQPIAVNRTGFRIATAAQAARLTRIVTGAHTNLSRRIGRDPRLGKGFQKRTDRGQDKDKKGADKKSLDKKGEKKNAEKKGLDKKGAEKKDGLDRKNALDKKSFDKKDGKLDKKGEKLGGPLKKFGQPHFNPRLNGRGQNMNPKGRGKFELRDRR